MKKGQAFIGIDNNKYYFLGYDYDDQIMFTNLDLWTDKEKKYIVKNNVFVKEILEEKSEVIENCAWYYQSLKELENASTEEKIKRCLDIIENSNTSEITLRPTQVGELVRGQAYSEELNQFYEVIGFIVKNNFYIDNELRANHKGFFSIYHSNCDDTVPLIFERSDTEEDSFDKERYVASNGNTVTIIETIMNKDKINSYLNESDLIKRIESSHYDERKI